MFLKEPISEEVLKEKLQSFVNRKIFLKLNSNRSTYLRISQKNKMILLSLHKMFLFACDEVIDQIGMYISSPKKKSPFFHVKKFVNHYTTHHQIKKDPVVAKLKTKGSIFDLEKISLKINEQYFDEKISIFITWAKRKTYVNYRQITYGTYDPLYRLVSINPLLDHSRVPYYFIAFIIYHEMLHHIVPLKVDSLGRRWVHTKEFKAKEKLFLEYNQAKDFQKKFVERIIYGRS